MTTWIKLHDNFWEHPKVLAAGEDAALLYVQGLSYCSRNLTDGCIPAAALRTLTARKAAPTLARTLVREGLWTEMGTGWEVHDYTDVQRSRAQVEAERKATRDRAARYRASHAHNAVSHAVSHGEVTAPEADTETDTEKAAAPRARASTADQRQERLAAAAKIIGERAAQRPGVANPAAMTRAVAKGVITDRHTEAYAIIAANPSIVAADLAEQLEPTPPAVPEPYNISSHLLPVDDVAPWGGQHWEEGATALADIRAERGWANPATNPGASHA